MFNSESFCLNHKVLNLNGESFCLNGKSFCLNEEVLMFTDESFCLNEEVLNLSNEALNFNTLKKVAHHLSTVENEALPNQNRTKFQLCLATPHAAFSQHLKEDEV